MKCQGCGSELDNSVVNLCIKCKTHFEAWVNNAEKQKELDMIFHETICRNFIKGRIAFWR